MRFRLMRNPDAEKHMMNALKSLPQAGLRGWTFRLALLLAAILISFSQPAQAQDLTLPVLKTKTGEYTNVTVTSKSQTEVHIMHSGGVQNIKMHELGDEALEQLGYAKPRDRAKEAEAAANEAMGKFLEALPIEPGESEEGTPAGPPKLEDVLKAVSWKNLTAESLSENLVTIGMALFVYLGMVSCFRTICLKAGYRPGFTIFIPVVQTVPIFRAAGMGTMWVILFLSPFLLLLTLLASLPLIPLNPPPAITWLFVVLGVLAVAYLAQTIASIVWCVRIVKARGKSGWVALFLILPFTSFFAFLYLVLSSGVEPKEDSAQPPPVPQSSSGKFVVGARA